MDILIFQETLWRQILDGLYQTSDARWEKGRKHLFLLSGVCGIGTIPNIWKLFLECHMLRQAPKRDQNLPKVDIATQGKTVQFSYSLEATNSYLYVFLTAKVSSSTVHLSVCLCVSTFEIHLLKVHQANQSTVWDLLTNQRTVLHQLLAEISC